MKSGKALKEREFRRPKAVMLTSMQSPVVFQLSAGYNNLQSLFLVFVPSVWWVLVCHPCLSFMLYVQCVNCYPPESLHLRVWDFLLSYLRVAGKTWMCLDEVCYIVAVITFGSLHLLQNHM